MKTKLLLAFFTITILAVSISILSTSMSFCNNLALTCQGMTIDSYRPYLELKIMKKNLFFSFLIIISFLSFLIYYITQRIFNPIKRLSKSINNAKKGKYNTHVDVDNNNDELSDLARAFNQMTSKLRIQEKEKYEFITGASHQFRTPLSKLQLETNELKIQLKKIPKTKHLKSLVEAIESSSIASTAIINDLFKVLELGENYQATKTTKIDINELLVNIIQSQIQKTNQKKINVEVDIQKNLKATANESALKTVFINLLDNAITYSKKSSTITIKANKKNNLILFQIIDTGIGIPEEDQIYIFNKFFRAKNAYQEKNIGTGLGLYIVKTIIEGHKGNLMFESKPDKGSTFYFSLPSKTSV